MNYVVHLRQLLIPVVLRTFLACVSSLLFILFLTPHSLVVQLPCSLTLGATSYNRCVTCPSVLYQPLCHLHFPCGRSLLKKLNTLVPLELSSQLLSPLPFNCIPACSHSPHRIFSKQFMYHSASLQQHDQTSQKGLLRPPSSHSSLTHQPFTILPHQVLLGAVKQVLVRIRGEER